MSRYSQAFFFGSVLAAALTMYGCGDSSSDDSGEDHMADHMADHEHGATGCGNVDNCMGTIDLEAEMLPFTIAGEDGNLSVMLHMFSSPVVPSPNEWMVMLMDADGPVAGGELSASTWSVDCGHPGPNDAEVVTTDDNGMAKIHPETLHGGPWDVIIEASANGVTDTITFNICIDAPGHDETLGGADAGT